MGRIEDFLHSIPLAIINAISVISGILTIISFLATALSAIFSKPEYVKKSGSVFLVCTLVFGYLYWKKLVKYRELAQQRLSVHSTEMALVNEKITETVFDILHFYKAKQLSHALLDTKIKNSLQALLDSIERMMLMDTGRTVSACIKLILPSEENLNLDNAYVETFVRSTRCDLTRNTNDVQDSAPDLIKSNTDFYNILSDNLIAFYQGDLLEYERELARVGKHYMNSHLNWQEHYLGAIVVPIKIQHQFLHFTKKDKDFQVVGFLCVDSMAKDAFLPRQKDENIAFLQAYASLIYILLNKYQYYLSKLVAKNGDGFSA
ncbi:hypothetical protein AALA82_18805 [Oscillospiraceae bacterium 50-16]